MRDDDQANNKEKFFLFIACMDFWSFKKEILNRRILELKFEIEKIGFVNSNQSKKYLKSFSIVLELNGDSNNFLMLNAELKNLSSFYQIDLCLISKEKYDVNYKLIVFDMDSTLIKEEVVDELSVYIGKRKEVELITEKAMKGEISFLESFKKRMRLLEGVDVRVCDEIALRLNDGVDFFIERIKSFGCQTAIISGGIDFFARSLQKKLNIDFVYANRLDILDGKVTGNIINPVIDGDLKKKILTNLSDELSIKLKNVIAIGDGSNDIPMLKTAGLGVAFHAKPKVRNNIDHIVSYLGMDSVLFFSKQFAPDICWRDFVPS